MPIYEYACDKCGHEWEVEQRITDDPIKTCPVCRSRKVKKLISQTSFVLKGGGWYSDLYSSKKEGGDAKSDNDGGGESGTSTDADKKDGSKSDGGKSKDEGKSKGKGKGKGKGKSKAAA